MSSCISTSNVDVSHKVAIRVGLSVVLLCLLFIALINIIIDPEGVYLRDYLGKKHSESQAAQLLSSEFGLPYTGAERPFKYALARVSKADCYVIGSSRAFQISLRKEGWLPEECATLANLGVSGGSMEDMLILSDGLRRKRFSGVFLVLDPWDLNSGLPSRWVGYERQFDRIAESLGVSFPQRSTNIFDRVRNVINFSYFMASYEKVAELGLGALPNFEYVPLSEVARFDTDVGLSSAVTLTDGSHVYAATFIENSKEPDLSRLNYMEDRVAHDTLGVEVLEGLLDFYNNIDVKVTLLLSPYHHRVFNDSNSAYREAITNIEKLIREIAEDKDVKVRGSYDPRVVGCNETEFFDAFHPTINCMSRIDLN